MKWVLAISLSLNVAFTVVLVMPKATPRNVPPQPPSPPVTMDENRSLTSMASDAENTIQRKKTRPPETISLEGDDFARYIQKLREAGLGEDSVVQIIAAELRERELEERFALGAKLKRTEITQADFNQRVKQVHRDMETRLESLLGRESYRRHQIQQDYHPQSLAESGRFSEDVLEKVYDLNKKYADKRSEISERTQGLGYLAYQVEAFDVERAYRVELEQTFGPEVARQIRLATDDQALRLRSQMAAVSLTDEELDRAAQIIKHTNEEKQRLQSMQARGDISYGELSPQQSALDQEQNEQLKAILGPERFAEYEKQNDHLYTGLKPNIASKVMSRVEVEHVYRVVKDMQWQQNELSSQSQTQQVSREDVRAAIQQLQQSTKKALQEYLGAERFQKIQPYTGLQ